MFYKHRGSGSESPNASLHNFWTFPKNLKTNLLYCCENKLDSMPLLVLCGYPSSGKTTITLRLDQFFREKGLDVSVLDDFSADSEFSKTKLADHNNGMRSEVLRRLSTNKDLFLIVDSLNYARSQRYELSTVAKNVRTTFGILFCDADKESCLFLNRKRQSGYSEELMEDIFARFERPNARLSGERPLFEVTIRNGFESDLTVFPKDATLPFVELFNWFVCSQPVKQNASVTASQKTSTDFVQEIDKLTQDVVKHIIDYQHQVGPGGYIVFPWDEGIRFQVKRISTFPVLMKLRTQFLIVSRKNLTQTSPSITKLFVDYLSCTCV